MSSKKYDFCLCVCLPLYSYKNNKNRHLSNVKFFLRETTLRGEPLIIDTICDFFFLQNAFYEHV